MQSAIGNWQSAIGNHLVRSLALAALIAFAATASRAHAISTAFTYQGHLTFSDQPINNVYDMCFSLYGEEAQEPGHLGCGSLSLAGSLVFDGNDSNPPPVTVADGIFTVLLDFQAPTLFDGKALWLEIALKPHGPDPDYILLGPRTPLTGTPHALGLRYPQTGRAEIDGPMFKMTQIGEGSVLQIESSQGTIQGSNSSPTFTAINQACGTASSIILEPPGDPMMCNPTLPALVVTNRANGVAASFYVPDPQLPIEDGCPPQCPPFPWPWVDVVAPGIDVINQSGGPAGRFATDSNLLLPAVHVANEGAGGAIHARNNNALPTLDATNLGTGTVIKALGNSPDVFGAIEIENRGGGPAAVFRMPPIDCPPPPCDWPWDWLEAPAIAVSNGRGGSAAHFATDAADALLPVIRVENTGAGMGLEVVSQGAEPTVKVANTGTGAAIRAVNTAGLCFDGEGDLRVSGEITKNYGNGSPSFHGTSPIAYATINSDGTMAAGTPNVSSVWNLPNQRYEITITGETYATTTHVTTVTPIANALPEALFATTSSGAGQLRIRIMSSSTGTAGLQKPFQFIVYKP